MDWSLVIFVLVVLYFTYRGYQNGLLKSISRVLSILAGYVCAILFTGEVSGFVETEFGLQGIAALISATLSLFIGAGIVVSFIFWLIAEFVFEDDTPSTTSSIGGTAVGSIVGVLLAIIIVWTYTFVRDIHNAESFDAAARAKSTPVESLANKVASTALNTAMSMGSAEPEVAKLSAALVESPAEITQRSQRLMESQDLLVLLNDPANQRVLNSGDHKAVQKLPAFKTLAQNPDLRALAKSAGFMDNSDNNGQSVETRIAMQLTDIWGRAQRVKNDPRVQQILDDPEFQQKVQSGNPLDLLTNTKLLELADIIFSDSGAAGEGTDQSTDGTPAKDASPKKSVAELYEWTDSSGRVYYSDQKPKQ